MRIQNNITAMNTHRQYTINNDNVAKSAEKLSSGYRINRAGDDAAGLAISEKMRSQIRGLNMATKNSQDAISLVQTAEGALQETHSMLQRMNELAVQAATGTNEDLDRTALAKEFEQLKREINDVAEQTNFNNMKILDGSMSYTGYVRSAATAGVSNSTQEVTTPQGVEITQTAKAQDLARSATFTATLATVALDAAGGKVELEVGDAKLEVSATGAQTTAQIAAAFVTKYGTSGSPATINGVKYEVSAGANAGELVFTAVDKGLQTGTNAPLDSMAVKLTATADGTGTATQGTATISNSNAGSDGNATAAVAEEYVAVLDATKLNEGDKITIDDLSYTIKKDDLADQKTLMAAITTAFDTKTTAGNATVAVEGSTIKVTSATPTFTAPTGAAGDVAAKDVKDTAKITFEPKNAQEKSYKNTVEFDTAKMKDGDTFTFTFGGKTASVTFESKKYQTDPTVSAAEKFAADVAAAFDNSGIKVTANGNAVIFTGEKVDVAKDVQLDSAAANSDKYPHNAIRIQVGALEDEQLAVSIDAMNTAGLELDEHNLDTQNSASMAITAVRDAINKVSDQRATLGAMQNRLDHKIANLKVSSENLSAAESRIRDVDMASEMTNFTKNNILSQAATAMLAQANALPQNVLSLLG